MSKRKFHIDGKKLSIAREMCGLSQEELASRAGCSRRTIERLEQKSGGYYPNTLASIASVLEVNTEDLVVVAKPTIPQSKPSSDTETVHEEHSDADLDEWVRSRIDSARKNFRGTR
nr:helix-turn-helix transcriptional regulator [Planctomycetota bacterium]